MHPHHRYYVPKFNSEESGVFVARNKWLIVKEAEDMVKRIAPEKALLEEYRREYDAAARRDEGGVSLSLCDDATIHGLDLERTSRRVYRLAVRDLMSFLSVRLDAMAVAHCDRPSRKWIHRVVSTSYLHVNTGGLSEYGGMGVLDVNECGETTRDPGGGTYTEPLLLLMSEIVHHVRLDFSDDLGNRMEDAMDPIARRMREWRRRIDLRAAATPTSCTAPTHASATATARATATASASFSYTPPGRCALWSLGIR